MMDQTLRVKALSYIHHHEAVSLSFLDSPYRIHLHHQGNLSIRLLSASDILAREGKFLPNGLKTCILGIVGLHKSVEVWCDRSCSL